MSDNWIIKRLSKIKQQSDGWSQLSIAMQSTIDTLAEPLINRMKGMQSLFTADDVDINIVEKELGDFFKVSGDLAGKDKALALLVKRDDINHKETLKPVKDMFLREFSGLKIEWEALYANGDLLTYPYGTSLITHNQIVQEGLNKEEYFLTSRGKIRLNAHDILAQGYSLSEFSLILRDKVDAIRPVHIVYDGEEIFLLYELLEQPDLHLMSVRNVRRTFPAIDDSHLYSAKRSINRKYNAFTNNVIKYQYFKMDELPCDVFPTDTKLEIYGETYTV
ncbi:hypothetical protein KO527_05455 [Pseudoalteromonas sp. C2R02]|uniref:hypothetical protein n=1 Tax=Pseudoalteromonas sp. C2R02 TaxID=2841565 RepID=UPI001C09126E|nr:hypothetical protein [Pseudoalteromonas sp. C2R02]MBU2968795.1 hypothetical protein [Pseudoalteromonas sp. C2R02]